MRKKMSKYMAVAMALILAFLITGCSKEAGEETADNSQEIVAILS